MHFSSKKGEWTITEPLGGHGLNTVVSTVTVYKPTGGMASSPKVEILRIPCKSTLDFSKGVPPNRLFSWSSTQRG